MDLTPLRVALPLGIGDCHWSCTKLAGLSALHGGRPIEAHVNCSPNHASVGYLQLVPSVARAVQSKEAPYDILREMPPHPHDPRWSTLEGCRHWRGFDYVLVANGHLERGERIDTWLPEVETQFSYALNIPALARNRWAHLAGQVLVYLSGVGPNEGFHKGTWRIDDWVAVLRGLNDRGRQPVLVGANTPDDKTYRDWVVRLASRQGLQFTDTVGLTTIPEYCALIEAASCWVGLNSGGGIVSAMRGTPTVMLWSDSRYPIKGVRAFNLPLNHAMQTNWLHESQLATYRTLSFGAPTLTPANVVAAVLEVAR